MDVYGRYTLWGIVTIGSVGSFEKHDRDLGLVYPLKKNTWETGCAHFKRCIMYMKLGDFSALDWKRLAYPKVSPYNLFKRFSRICLQDVAIIT